VSGQLCLWDLRANALAHGTISRGSNKAVARACHRRCFGPIMPVGFARERLGAWRDIASYKQGGRARLSQALLAKNKRRSERSSRCAARAALDLTSATNLKAYLASYILQRSIPQPPRHPLPYSAVHSLK
ncbi:hypothetical protein, partial [Pseudomonas hunanensis]|uniref:hypothetical protein n=1 Tax=Pseudomonas hunanensis TaxID=1247546 RepID=UPI001C4B03CF